MALAVLAAAAFFLRLAPASLNACPTSPALNASYATIYSIPNGCEQSSCDYFLAARLNDADPTYLDFWLEGNADGWIAVGFSATPLMANSDVLACALDSNNDNTAVAIDAWNGPGNSNTRDTQQDLCPNVLEYTGGRFMCSFSRAINTGDPNGQDLQLDDNLFLLLGTGSNPSIANPPALTIHTVTPLSSSSMLNVVSRASESDYRVFARIPADCKRSSCTYYLAVRTNPDDPEFLDFELEGDAQSWIAIGLSKTASMESADVSGCVVQADNSVAVVDAWNTPDSTNNVRDTLQDISFTSSSFGDSRISCTFSRPIVSGDTEQDLPMNDNYYLLFGRGNTSSTAQPPALNYHGPLTPVWSNSLVDITTATGEVGPPAEIGPSNCPPAPASDAVYRLNATVPDGCPDNADFTVRVRTNDQNSSFLDFYLEGDTSGWIAVGFSPTDDMLTADVFACVVSTDGSTVFVNDAWNLPSSRSNVRDTIQDVCLHSTNFENGRISCIFSRAIRTSDTDNDLDLNGTYFMLLGRGNSQSDTGTLTRHENNPPITVAVNPTVFSGCVPLTVNAVRAALTRVHGILMVVAWPVLAVTAIFFAAFMKPALPNGEWFQVHRAFNVASLIIGATAFFFIFVANYRRNGLISLTTSSADAAKVAHFTIGIFVMLLHIVNPLISICRCKPGGENRWIFNLFHATLIGYAAELFALVNAGIGLHLFGEYFSRDFGNTLLWIFIAFVAAYSILIVVLLLVFFISSVLANNEKLAPSFLQPIARAFSKEEKVQVEMSATGSVQTKEDPMIPKARKKPSKDSFLRWIGFGVFAAVMVPTMLAIIVLIIIPQ